MANIIYKIKNLQIRGDTAANLRRVNTVLKERELCIETDTNKLKIGDGVNAWNTLPYFGGADGSVDVEPLLNLIGEKQDKLSEAQTTAVNSGITRDKVTQYDRYNEAIGNTYTKLEVNELLLPFLRYFGGVETDLDLPYDNVNAGDICRTINTDVMYIYDGMAWHPIDQQYDDTSLQEQINAKQDVIEDLQQIREGALREISLDSLEFNLDEEDVEALMKGDAEDGE